MGPHQNAAIFRRFGSLTMLNLMGLQAELLDLEIQLQDTIKEDDESSDTRVQNYSSDFYELYRSEPPNKLQKELLETSRDKLERYCKY